MKRLLGLLLLMGMVGCGGMNCRQIRELLDSQLAISIKAKVL